MITSSLSSIAGSCGNGAPPRPVNAASECEKTRGVVASRQQRAVRGAGGYRAAAEKATGPRMPWNGAVTRNPAHARGCAAIRVMEECMTVSG
jgi:hypothetical protein